MVYRSFNKSKTFDSAAFAKDVSFVVSMPRIQTFSFFTKSKCYKTYQLLYYLFLLFNFFATKYMHNAGRKLCSARE